MKFTSFFAGALIGLVGCGPVDPTDGDASVGVCTSAIHEGIRDERTPRLPDDPAYVDLYTTEYTVYPGEDKNLCVHVTYEGDDTGIQMFVPFQGCSGHHLLLMTTSDPKPPGTVEDCSKPETLRKLRPAMFPMVPMAGGRGIPLTKGMSLVLHSHHINAGSVPIQVRDRARLKKIDPRDVTHWVTPVALTSFNVELPPFAETTVEFDCTVPRDFKLLLVGGHMHEKGKRFRLSNLDPLSPNFETGSLGQQASEAQDGLIYEVQDWEDYFRDAPPISSLWSNPRPVVKSSLLRVECTWQNETANTIRFPEEMCAVFGYVEEVSPLKKDVPGFPPSLLDGSLNESFFCEAESNSVEGAPL